MNKIILTTPEELKMLFEDAVRSVLSNLKEESVKPDTITVEVAIEFLAYCGYPTSKAKIYKLTSMGEIPYKKYGNRLIFSRKELINWAEQQTKCPHNSASALERINKTIKRKRLY